MSGKKQKSQESSHTHSENSSESPSSESKKNEETLPSYIRVLLTFTFLQILCLIAACSLYYMIWSKDFVLHKYVTSFKSPKQVVYASLGLSFGLILLTHLPVLVARTINNPKGLNNKYPRREVTELTGWGHRAWASHNNAMEAFPPFAAGLLLGLNASISTVLLAKLGVLFVGARVAYTLAYIANLHYLRTTIWLVGFMITGSFFILPFSPNLYSQSPEDIVNSLQDLFSHYF